MGLLTALVLFAGDRLFARGGDRVANLLQGVRGLRRKKDRGWMIRSSRLRSRCKKSIQCRVFEEEEMMEQI